MAQMIIMIAMIVESLKREYYMRDRGRRPSRKGWMEGELVGQWERGRRPSRSSVNKSLYFRNIVNRIWRIHYCTLNQIVVRFNTLYYTNIRSESRLESI